MRIYIIVASVFGVAGMFFYCLPGKAVELNDCAMSNMIGGATCVYVQGTGAGDGTVGAAYKCCDCTELTTGCETPEPECNKIMEENNCVDDAGFDDADEFFSCEAKDKDWTCSGANPSWDWSGNCVINNPKVCTGYYDTKCSGQEPPGNPFGHCENAGNPSLGNCKDDQNNNRTVKQCSG